MSVKFLIIGILNLFVATGYAETENPCLGPDALLNIVDRPNNADSACVVPFKKIEMEVGFQSQQLSNHGGSLQNFPETEVRFGLPANNELFILLPNAIHLSSLPLSGYTNTVTGLKHQLAYSKNWIVTVEGILYLPDGSQAFGNKELGTAFNGILSYTINPQWNFTLMAGGGTFTDPILAGGRRYNSFNPDIVLTYALTDTFNIYGEIYAQSKTGASEGWGSNFDGGVLYLVTPNLAVDISAGQQLTGYPGGFNRYIGAGFSFMN